MLRLILWECAAFLAFWGSILAGFAAVTSIGQL